MAWTFLVTCIDVAYYFFGYISSFGKYVMQPISTLASGYITSFPLFSGGSHNVAFLPLGGILGDFISWVGDHVVGDLPIIVLVIILALSIGLIVKVIKSLL